MRTLRACDSVSAVGSIYSFTSDSSVLSGILSGLLPGVNGTDALLSPVWSGWLVLIYSRSFVSCSSVPFSNRVRDLFTRDSMVRNGPLALWFVQWIFKSLFGRIYTAWIHVQEHLGDRADVHYSFKKAENRREDPPTLHNGGGADGVQGHVGYSCEHDQPEREKYRGVHWQVEIQRSIVVMPAPAAASSIQRLIPFRGLTLWTGYFGSPPR